LAALLGDWVGAESKGADSPNVQKREEKRPEGNNDRHDICGGFFLVRVQVV
jgi:hypothetical protein